MAKLVQDSYFQALSQNYERGSSFEKYKKAHEELINNLSTLQEMLSPPVLVPVCSRVLMRGNLVHTNEIMVSLGGGYFVKCTVKDAQDICRRRCERVQFVLQELEKEHDFLESQVTFTHENVFASEGQEIIEEYDEKAEEEWRKQHRVRVRESKKAERDSVKDLDDKELMEKLDLLELQEEIEEMHASQEKTTTKSILKKNSTQNEVEDATDSEVDYSKELMEKLERDIIQKEVKSKKEIDPSKSKEFVLRKRLAALRQRKKKPCLTEEDVARRLDELEEEEELEDQLDRLYDGDSPNDFEGEDEEEGSSSEDASEDSKSQDVKAGILKDDLSKYSPNVDKVKRKVSFAENPIAETIYIQNPSTAVTNIAETLTNNVEDRPETIVLNFSHSDNQFEPVKNSPDLIESPSDIYTSFPECFEKQLKPSIKSSHGVEEEVLKKEQNVRDNWNERKRWIRNPMLELSRKENVVVGNIVERQKFNDESVTKNSGKGTEKPNVSKFKAMRLAKKK